MNPPIPLEGGGLIVNCVRLVSLILVDGASASSPYRSFGVGKFGQAPPTRQKTILNKYRAFLSSYENPFIGCPLLRYHFQFVLFLN